MAKSVFSEVALGFTGLGKEMFRQITGQKQKKKQHRNRCTCHNNNAKRQVEKIIFDTKKAMFENKKAYEIAQHTVRAKGWIK